MQFHIEYARRFTMRIVCLFLSLECARECHLFRVDLHIFPRIENANPFWVVWRIKMLAFDWKIFISFCAPFVCIVIGRQPSRILLPGFICLLLLVKQPILFCIDCFLLPLLLLLLFSQLQPGCKCMCVCVFCQFKKKAPIFPNAHLICSIRWYTIDAIHSKWFKVLSFLVQCAATY